MLKDTLLKKLQKAWEEFEDSYSGLAKADFEREGVTGNWSVKDIVAHVTAWEEEALKYLPVILSGRQPPRYSAMHGGVDAFNALLTERSRSVSLDEVLHRQEKVHNRLVRYIRSAPDEAIATDTRFRRRLRLDTYGHYPHHTRAIRAWREREDK